MSVDPEQVSAVDSENPPLRTAPISSSPPPSKPKGKKKQEKPKPEKKKPEKSEEDAEEEDSAKPAPQKKSVKKQTSEAEEKVPPKKVPPKKQPDSDSDSEPEEEAADAQIPEIKEMMDEILAAFARFLHNKLPETANPVRVGRKTIQAECAQFVKELKTVSSIAGFVDEFTNFLIDNDWEPDEKLTKKGKKTGIINGYSFDGTWEEFLRSIGNAPPAASAEKEEEEEESDA